MSVLAKANESSKTAFPPRVGNVGMTCLAKTRPEGNETTPPAILVPPASNPMAQLCVFELGSNIIRFVCSNRLFVVTA